MELSLLFYKDYNEENSRANLVSNLIFIEDIFKNEDVTSNYTFEHFKKLPIKVMAFFDFRNTSRGSLKVIYN